jgi:hypothetical protein
MLTTSDNDAEALVAIRSANKILADAGIDWNRVFDRTITVAAEFEAAPEESKIVRQTVSTHTREIEEAFTTIKARDPRGTFADFIASLKDQWDEKHFLTEKQKAALFRAAEGER